MHIYLDESGDLGFKKKEGSSKYLVISLLVVEKIRPIKLGLMRIKKDHKFPKSYELKANASTAPMREKVLRFISHQEVKIYSLILNKSRVFKDFHSKQDIFYNYISAQILLKCLSDLKPEQVHIWADKRTTKLFGGMQFSDYLKMKIWFENAEKMDIKISEVESHNSWGIQANDYVCWSIAGKYEQGILSYYNIIKEKIQEEIKYLF